MGGRGSSSNKTFSLEKRVGFSLSADTKSYIEKQRNNGMSLGDDTLSKMLGDFKAKVTPFTLSHLDDAINTLDKKIGKESFYIVKARQMVERDYLISLKKR